MDLLDQYEDQIRKCFTIAEWYNMSQLSLLHLRTMFKVYTGSDKYKTKYSLERFLKECVKLEPKPKREEDFWLNYPYETDSSNSSDCSDISDIPRKPSLEDFWDQSDRENASFPLDLNTRALKKMKKYARKRNKSKSKKIRNKKGSIGFKLKVKLRPRKTAARPLKTNNMVL
ncbi:hypothetical protein GWI33_020075 [Rhynchophorus ferrugineus]|uniref:Uncharacterized protein n=1 Tax=Rhynchophorus ferrugineus TaxID=354439 RepID=A0A834HQ30_RHYFE|nr:hypothetical protein GWI33_020075 [Rhynchophorus ferrugineus]